MKTYFSGVNVAVEDTGTDATSTADTPSCAKAEQFDNADDVENIQTTQDKRCTIGFPADFLRELKIGIFTTFVVFQIA